MSKLFKTLDIVSHQPKGISVIEASAGTGKTFTIMYFVLKSLVQLWLKDKTKGINQILVVTFTEAATKELRSRILQTISHAYKYFSNEEILFDSTEKEILDGLGISKENQQSFANYLKQQLNSIDDASIFTIHGFCNTVISEFPFECGIPGKFDLKVNLEEEKKAFITSKWREIISSSLLIDEHCQKLFVSPEEVMNNFRNQLGSSIYIEHNENVPEMYEQCWKELNKLSEEFNKRYSEADLKHFVDLIFESSALKKNIYNSTQHNSLLTYLSEGRANQLFETSSLRPELITIDGIQGNTKKNEQVDSLLHIIQEFVIDFSEIQNAIIALNVLKEELKANYLAQWQKGFNSLKKEQAWFSFDDLLLVVNESLKQNPRLIHLLREKYEYGFIDEFQDTDPVQFSIFKQIFLDAKSEGLDPTFYMIGDPKQSIYSFRNADLKTYIYARNLADHLYSLDTNYRSTNDLVGSVNSFFGLPEQAFILKEIDFNPVKSNSDKQIQSSVKEFEKPLIIFETIGGQNVEATRSRAMQKTIELVQFYVNKSMKLDGKDVEPGDIALLVNTNKQASSLYKRLRQAGIPSVIQSKQSVFSTDEAYHLYHIMNSIFRSQSSSNLKSALLTPLFIHTLSDLKQWESNEELILEVQEQFLHAKRLWYQSGFSAAYSFIVNTFQCSTNLVEFGEGDRSIANMNHLIDHLSKFERETKHSISKTIDFLKQKIKESEEQGHFASDEDILRLESDERKVKIVTIHSSKGLQYPIVIQPFTWDYKFMKNLRKNYVHSISASVGTTFPVIKKLFVNNDESLKLLNGLTIEQAQNESIEEEAVRNFYVGLTRAVYQNVLILPNGSSFINCKQPLGMIQKWASQIIKEIPSIKTKKDVPDYYQACIQALQQIDSNLYSLVSSIPKSEQDFAVQNPTIEDFQKPQKLNMNPIQPFWFDHSYSSLSKHSDSEYKEKEFIDDEEMDIQVKQSNWTSYTKRIDSITAGADIGNIIHYSLEQLTPENCDSAQEIVEEIAKRNGLEKKFESKLTEIVEWISRIYSTPFDRIQDEDIALKTIPKKKQLRELEFYFTCDSFNYADLEKIVRSQEEPSQPIAKGYIKGFIDFIFVHKGKFYLLDYKSNKLKNYTTSSLNDAMIEKQYDMQLAIYSVALHQFLQKSIKNYSFNEHFGGMYYWFVRGIDEPGKGMYFKKPELTWIESLANVLKGEIEHA